MERVSKGVKTWWVRVCDVSTKTGCSSKNDDRLGR